MNRKILILSGDPESINSELIYKSWNKINTSLKKRIYIISNYKLLKKQFFTLNYKINLEKVDNLNSKVLNSNLKIIDLNLDFKNPFKIEFKKSSTFISQSLNLAHKLALRKDVSAIINCPINKRLLKKGGIGVTEYLASKCNIRNNSEVMLISNNKLSVCPITTHIKISQVSQHLDINKIISKIKVIHSWFYKYFKKKPKIGILGLNPHNAELRKDSEENKFIIPAIQKLKKDRISINGPLVTDTLFIKEYKKYDVIVGMYHDQILTPFKTIFKFDAINITLGLKYLRISPDHGPAKDLIGKNKADYRSLLKCINFANTYKK
jgi:4-hydroxy-L-threonine phosphate dehydrogenase PdxA